MDDIFRCIFAGALRVRVAYNTCKLVGTDLLLIKLVGRPKAVMKMSFLPHDSVEIVPCQSMTRSLVFSVTLYQTYASSSGDQLGF